MHSILKILNLTEVAPGNIGSSIGGSTSDAQPTPASKPGLLNKAVKAGTKAALFTIGAKGLDKQFGLSDKAGKLATTSGREEVKGDIKTNYNRLINQFKDWDKQSLKKFFVVAKIRKERNSNASDNIVEFQSPTAVEAKDAQEASAKMRSRIVKEFKDANVIDPRGNNRATKYPEAEFVTWVLDKTKRFNTGTWEVNYLDANGSPHKLKLQIDKNKLTFMTGEEEYYENANYAKKYFIQKYGSKGYIPIKNGIKMVEENEMTKLANLEAIMNETMFNNITEEEKAAILIYNSLREVTRVSLSGGTLKLIGLNDKKVLVNKKYFIEDNNQAKIIYKHILTLKNKLQQIDPEMLSKIRLQEAQIYTEIPVVNKYPTQLPTLDLEYTTLDNETEAEEYFSAEDKVYFSVELTTQLFETVMLFLKLIKTGLTTSPGHEVIINRKAFEEFKTLFSDVVVEPVKEYSALTEVQDILSTRFYFRFDDLVDHMEKVKTVEEELTFGSRLSNVWDYLTILYNLMLPLMQKIVTESEFDFSDVVLDLDSYLNQPLDYNDVEVEYLYNLVDYVNMGV